MRDAWELIARWPGGTVAALASAESARGSAPVVAATAAGLHTSVDGGLSWTWVALGPAPVPEALVVSPEHGADGTVLLGTASGVYRSTNAGRDWRLVLVGSRVHCIAATRDFAEGGVVLAGTEGDGILRSEDGGRGWLGASAGLLDLTVTALALSPDVAHDRTAFAGTTSGLFRSRNGGRAWRMIELGPEAPIIQSLAVSPTFADDGVVLAGTESDGLFRSDDSGQTWGPVRAFPEPCVTSLAFAQAGPGGTVVAAGTAAGIAMSRDGGQTWTVEAADLGPILSLAFTGNGDDQALLAGTVNSGIARRALAGGEWAPSNQGLAGRATVDLAISMAYGSVPLVAVASLDAGVLLSHDGGETWASGYRGLPDLAASSVGIVRSASGQPSVLATFAGGLFRSEDLDAGWLAVDVGGAADGHPAALTVLGDVGSGASTILAAGAPCLSLSFDSGERWRALPLPGGRVEVIGAAASPDVSRDRTVYAVTRAIRLASDGALEYDGMELWQTDDLGQRWNHWLHAPNATVMALAVPRAGDLEASLLVGHTGRVARPLRSTREVRRGKHRPLWQETRIGNQLSAVTSVALSPRVRTDRTILASADAGIYLSRDGGATFEAWDHGLDVPLVTSVALVNASDGDTLAAYALGLGGTLWRRRL